MATMLDRLREGLIWSYAALSLLEEQRAKNQQWWDQERMRLKEEARAHLDDALRQMEERRAQRADWANQSAGWLKERVRAGLAESGLITRDEVEALQQRIDQLTAEVARLQGEQRQQEPAAEASSASTSHIVLPPGVEATGRPGEIASGDTAPAEGGSLPGETPLL